MFGYSRNKFGCFITSIEENIAYVTLCDKDGEKSFMEIPVEDLEDNNILCETGVIFRFFVTQLLGWEKISFVSSTKPIMPFEEVKKLRKCYEEKYGDI